MSVFDWCIVAVFLGCLTAIAVYTNRYTKSVADFLASNRCAGRYLLSAADGMVAFGLTSVIMFFEIYYQAGFTAQWWQMTWMWVSVIAYLTGYVVYRFRRTRSLTLLQFFEQRYSKTFRIFVGFLSFWVFLITMGIMPGTGARFFMFACNLPDSFMIFGFCCQTFPVVTGLLLTIGLFFTYCGGHIAVMVTDFLQAMFCNVVLLIIMIVLIMKIPWSMIIEGLKLAPENASMINPFKTGETQTYNFWFFAIWAVNFIYMFPAWQGQQAYYSASKSPHETRMARILGNVRGTVTYSAILVIPIVAYVIMHHPEFSQTAAAVKSRLSGIPSEYYQRQMTVPAVINTIIPMGLFGLFIAAMLGAMISTLDTLLHAWGSIFIQDVVLPFRKKPFGPKIHMHLLRLATLGVAVFLFCFSVFYNQKQDIWLFWAMIGSFYYAGAGIALALGLYWKRGTTLGAWAGMITGIVFTAVVWYALEQLPAGQTTVKWAAAGMEFDLNAQHFSIIIAVTAFISYVIFSLIKPSVCDFDKLFHRGRYTLDSETDEPRPVGTPGFIARILGVNASFTRGDRIIYYIIILNVAVTVGVILVISVIGLFRELSEGFWSTVWLIYVWNIVISGGIVTVWFLIGGAFDLKELFKRLSTVKRDDLDDGMVVGHQNLDEKKELSIDNQEVDHVV